MRAAHRATARDASGAATPPGRPASAHGGARGRPTPARAVYGTPPSPLQPRRNAARRYRTPRNSSVDSPPRPGSAFCDDGGMTEAARTRISARVGGIAESATLAVDARAKALKAAGRPVIGFGVGEPDFPTPDYIVAAAAEACRDPRNHHYTPTGGLPELRGAVAAKTVRDSGYAA